MTNRTRTTLLWLLLTPLGCASPGVVVVPASTQADSLSVSPASLLLEVGDSAMVAATTTNALGVSIPGPVSWTSSNPAVASVSSQGLVVALSPGASTIVASASGVSASLPTTVTATTAPPPPLNQIVVDGAGRERGPLPAIIYALADDATGADLYPLLAGGIYLFGLFDTGATRVRVYNEVPYVLQVPGDPDGGLQISVPNRITDGNFFGSDAAHLKLVAEEAVRVRLNGLAAVDPTTLGAPVDPGLAQLEVPDIPARPEPLGPGQPLNVTRIGGTIQQSIVASIDYTTRIERSPYDFYPGLSSTNRTPVGTGVPGFSPTDRVAGPDITFHPPGDAAIPSLPLELPLTRIGGQEGWYGIQDVEFRHSGASVTTGSGLNPPPGHVLFDTAAPTTLIGDAVANGLALTPAGGAFDCEGGTSNAYVLDAIELSGPGGVYTVDNAVVCWQQGRVQSPLLLAIAGANLFDQVPIVFDGSGDRLRVGDPTTTPVPWG